MEGHIELSLATINNGAAEEIFAREVKEVLKNIDDPSTSPKESRKIIMEFEFTPAASREMGVVEIKSKTKLAPIESVGSTFVIRDGQAIEPNYHQPEMPFGNVSKIDNKSRAAGERDDG